MRAVLFQLACCVRVSKLKRHSPLSARLRLQEVGTGGIWFTADRPSPIRLCMPPLLCKCTSSTSSVRPRSRSMGIVRWRQLRLPALLLSCSGHWLLGPLPGEGPGLAGRRRRPTHNHLEFGDGLCSRQGAANGYQRTKGKGPPRVLPGSCSGSMRPLVWHCLTYTHTPPSLSLTLRWEQAGTDPVWDEMPAWPTGRHWRPIQQRLTRILHLDVLGYVLLWACRSCFLLLFSSLEGRRHEGNW